LAGDAPLLLDLEHGKDLEIKVDLSARAGASGWQRVRVGCERTMQKQNEQKREKMSGENNNDIL
jgi:hypothetical protein